MDGLLRGDATSTGGIGFMMLAIFLVVLFVLFRRGGIGGEEGGIGNLLPLGAAMLERRNDSPADQIAINRMANFVDPEMAQLLKDQALDTGRIEHDIDLQTCQLQRSLDQQSCELEKGLGRVRENTDRNFLEAERIGSARFIDEKNDEINKLRLAMAEKEALVLHERTNNHIAKSNCELNERISQLAGMIGHRIDRVEDHMLKRPPVWGLGSTPLVQPFGVPCRHHDGFGFEGAV